MESSLQRLLEVTAKVKQKQLTNTNEKKLAKATSKFFRDQGSKLYDRLTTHWAISEALRLNEKDETDQVNNLFDLSTKDINSTYEEIAQRIIEDTFLVGAKDAIKMYKLGISFDLKNPRAVAYLKNHAAQLVKELNQTTKDRIATIVTEGVDQGLSYQKIARQIKNEFSDYAKLTTYGPKHINSRAELVAVTEIGNAYQEANISAIRDAMDTGLEFEKYWSNTGDNKVSDGCLDNTADDWIGIDELFSSGDDRPLRFPGCRCALLMRRKGSSD